MISTITKTFRFEAAHHLPLHNGKCRHDHGHSYKVEVSVRGRIRDSFTSDHGMVVDFQHLNKAFKSLIFDRLDHFDINSILDHPTAERLALWIFEELQHSFPTGTELLKVTVWETEDCSATIEAGEYYLDSTRDLTASQGAIAHG